MSAARAEARIQIEECWWDDVWPECESLMRAHWEEVREPDSDLPFKVDEVGSRNLCKLGLMKVLSARCQGELVGYLFWFLVPCLESAGKVSATLGPFYVWPEFAGAGGKLWAAGIEILKRNGIKTAYGHVSEFGPRKELVRKFMLGKGGKPYETKFMFKVK